MTSRFWVYLSLVVAALIWGSSFVALKYAVMHIHWAWVIFLRMSVASVLFLFVLKRISKFEHKKGDWKFMLFMGLCEPCLYFVFESLALENTSASQAGMISSIAPLLVGVAALIFLKEKLSLNAWLGFLLAVIGTAWLSFGSEATEASPNPILGNFLEVCAMVCAVGYILSIKVLSARYSSWFLTAVQAFIGSVFFACFLPFVSMPQWGELDQWSIVSVLYLGAFVSIGAYGLYNYGVSQVKSAEATAFANLVPVSAVLVAYFVLNETFTTQQWMACGLVLLGVVLSQLKFPSKAELPHG